MSAAQIVMRDIQRDDADKMIEVITAMKAFLQREERGRQLRRGNHR